MGRSVFLPIKGQLRKEMRRAERERGGRRIGRNVDRGQEGRKRKKFLSLVTKLNLITFLDD